MPIFVECPTPLVIPQNLKVTIPGGAELSALVSDLNATSLQTIKALLTQANSALAPLMPFFNILDAVLQLKECFEAIPDALGPPPDPTVLAECLEKLAEKFAKLLGLVPQLSVPLMIIDIIDALIIALDGIITQLEFAALQQSRIIAAGLRATEPGNGALGDIVECAQGILDRQQRGLGESLGPLNLLIGTLNLFLELLGLDPIPSLDDLPSDSTEAIAQLRVVIDLLRVIRNSIPVP